MTKFNPRKYRGDRIWVSLNGYPGVSRIWNWDKIKELYDSPERGKLYLARKGGASRKTKTFATREEACSWMRGVLVPETNVHPKGYTMGDLIYDWQKAVWPTFRESTRIFYSKLIVHFNLLEDLEVEKLTPANVDNWLLKLKSPERLKAYSLTRKTLLKELDCLNSIINWYIECHDETKLISPIKKRHAKMAIIKEVPSKQCRYMSSDEYQRWLSCLKAEAPLFYVLAVVQTRQLLRISEVCAMKWSNLDLANRTYRLCEHIIWPRVGGRLPEIHSGTKNMKSGEVHHLPLRQDVIEVLSELRKTAKE